MAGFEVSAIFKIDRQGFNLRRGVSVLLVMLIPVVVLGALGEEEYFVSVALGALFTGLCDPGGRYSYRAPRLVVIAVSGALLTALGYWLGAQAWGLVVPAAFLVTVLAGLAVTYGMHRFVAALLLNIWFLVALALPAAYRADGVHTSAWPQALAWLIGSGLMIGYIGLMWLASGSRPARGARRTRHRKRLSCPPWTKSGMRRRVRQRFGIIVGSHPLTGPTMPRQGACHGQWKALEAARVRWDCGRPHSW
ncbi:hypothetical protein [Streptomyces sp. NPDC090445]|uniref:hypothetical protein n=1 Tax=Streptomyces sp. NPDC090445 TaxID=3365963 RepID=UPI003801DD85